MKIIKEEEQIQKGFVYWFRKTYSQIPIGMSPITKMSVQQGARMKAAGYTRGWPDIFIPIPHKSWGGLFIEFKSPKGKISDHQKKMLTDLYELGYKTAVCRSIEDAMTVVRLYLRA